jgi:hypothetical protein
MPQIVNGQSGTEKQQKDDQILGDVMGLHSILDLDHIPEGRNVIEYLSA